MDEGLQKQGAPSAALRVRQDYAVADPHDDSAFSPGAGLLRLTEHETRRGGRWWAGDFVDYRGLVTIQMEDRFLRLDTVAGGVCHVRTWQRPFEDRTIAKLCRAFLTDLHGDSPGGYNDKS